MAGRGTVPHSGWSIPRPFTSTGPKPEGQPSAPVMTQYARPENGKHVPLPAVVLQSASTLQPTEQAPWGAQNQRGALTGQLVGPLSTAIEHRWYAVSVSLHVLGSHVPAAYINEPPNSHDSPASSALFPQVVQVPAPSQAFPPLQIVFAGFGVPAPQVCVAALQAGAIHSSRDVQSFAVRHATHRPSAHCGRAPLQVVRV